MVAEVTIMSRAMRVMMEKVPEPMVSMPRVSKACCDAGTIHRYQISRKGVATKEGTSHLTLHWTMVVLRAGCLSPSMRLAVISAQMPASAQQTQARRKRLGQYVGLKKAYQNLLASCPVPATANHASPGVSMKVRMPLMMMRVKAEAPA